MLSPDICLLNGRVFTVDANDAVTEALAVYGGRIVATGTTREIRALAGAATRVIDLAVLAEDPAFEAPERIKDIDVDMTIVDGRVAFERG